MHWKIAQFAVLVREYDEAIAFYCDRVGFTLIEDTAVSPRKRWARLGADDGFTILLVRAESPDQLERVGNQVGGRVLFYLHTDDLDRDAQALRSRGVEFSEAPRQEPYGKVAVFKDLYGNRIDLIEPRAE
jgi:catechol 2,3-dioxygenase-like lactoylglutathione lyase family enzyme